MACPGSVVTSAGDEVFQGNSRWAKTKPPSSALSVRPFGVIAGVVSRDKSKIWLLWTKLVDAHDNLKNQAQITCTIVLKCYIYSLIWRNWNDIFWWTCRSFWFCHFRNYENYLVMRPENKKFPTFTQKFFTQIAE